MKPTNIVHFPARPAPDRRIPPALGIVGADGRVKFTSPRPFPRKA